MNDPSKGDAEPSTSRYGGTGYNWYVVGVLTLIYTCHALDRSLPNILIEPIRHEFKLSDSQLGMFSGLAYGLAFATAILPMGYIADRANRRNLLALILVLWSALTAFAGITRNFGQLLLTRIGVGAAEAGAAPMTIPMISDIFPPKKRAFALGVLYVSNPVGTLLASVLGGFIAAEYGWRAAFLIAGIPGIFLAVLMLTTVREPKRGASETTSDTSSSPTKPPKLRDGFAFLMKKPGLLCLIGGCALLGLTNIALGAWMGSFFIRVHGLSLKETGVILGVGGGLCSMISPPLMGWLADKLSARDVRWPIRLVWITSLMSLALTMVMLFSPSIVLVVICFALADMTRHGYTPPTYSVLMTHTPAQLRGSVMSVLQFTTVLAGFGLGPLFIGVLSDLYGGGLAIRYALANGAMLFVLVAILLIIASRLLYGPRDGTPAPVAEPSNAV